MALLSPERVLMYKRGCLQIFRAVFVFVFLIPLQLPAQTNLNNNSVRNLLDAISTQDEGEEGIIIEIMITATGLLEDVDAVDVSCSLFSKLGDYPGLSDLDDPEEYRSPIGYAKAYMWRGNEGDTPYVGWDSGTPMWPFVGNSFEETVRLRFSKSDDSTIPLEFWTAGECNLKIVKGEMSGNPRHCVARDFRNVRPDYPQLEPLNCVLPTANPEDASVRFQRPGFANFDPETGLITESGSE